MLNLKAIGKTVGAGLSKAGDAASQSAKKSDDSSTSYTPDAPASSGGTVKKTLGKVGAGLSAAASTVPKMHKGGPVKTSGSYNLKAGEHVLTASEAELAKKHALLASGMKSLAKAGASAKPKGNASIGAIEPMPAKPKTFTDKNLEPGYGEGGANNVTTRGAKPGGTIRLTPNATPKMKPPVSSVSKT